MGFLVVVLLILGGEVVVLGLLFGIGYGAYQSVDFALAADVLPDADNAAKDLGVWNIGKFLLFVACVCLICDSASTMGSVTAPLCAGVVLDLFKAIGMAKFQSPRLGYTILFTLATVLYIISTVLVSLIKLKPPVAVDIALQPMRDDSVNQEVEAEFGLSMDVEDEAVNDTRKAK